jgi:hypothetical protein
MTIKQIVVAVVVVALIIAAPVAVAGGVEQFGEGLAAIWGTWTDGQ